MRLDLAIVQDVGKRSEQQDSATAHGLPTGNGVMLVVADGLGGHVGGATASRLAIEAFADATQNAAFDSHRQRRSALEKTLHDANSRITEASRDVGPKETMGTTLISAIVAEGAVRWISVGDSHLYLWRAGTLSKLNADHSQAGLMVASGRFKPDDKELDPYRSLLRSALTGRGIELIDDPEHEVAIGPGDVIVLSSDGLNTISNADIARIVQASRNEGAELLAARLVNEVRKRDQANQDNTSVVVACIDGVAEAVTTITAPPTAPGAAAIDRAQVTAVVTTPVLTGTESARDASRNGAAGLGAGGLGAGDLGAGGKLAAGQGAAPTDTGADVTERRPARILTAEARDVVAPAARSSVLGPILAVLGLAALGGAGYLAYQIIAAPVPPPVATTPARTPGPAVATPPVPVPGPVPAPGQRPTTQPPVGQAPQPTAVPAPQAPIPPAPAPQGVPQQRAPALPPPGSVSPPLAPRPQPPAATLPPGTETPAQPPAPPAIGPGAPLPAPQAPSGLPPSRLPEGSVSPPINGAPLRPQPQGSLPPQPAPATGPGPSGQRPVLTEEPRLVGRPPGGSVRSNVPEPPQPLQPQPPQQPQAPQAQTVPPATQPAGQPQPALQPGPQPQVLPEQLRATPEGPRTPRTTAPQRQPFQPPDPTRAP